MDILERLTPKKMNYVLFWFLVSAVIYGIWEGLSLVLNATDYRLFRLALSFFGYWILPVNLIWAKQAFQVAIKGLNTIVDFPTNDYSEWARKKVDSMFSINTRGSVVRLVVTITAIVVFSLLSTHILYRSFLPNLIAYLVAGFVFVMGIMGQQNIERLLGFLNELETYPARLPVFRIRHPELLKLFQFYIRTSIFVFLLVFLMFLFLLTTPFGKEFIVLILISITTFYPLSLLLWSAYKIHVVMARAKESHVEMLTQKIQICFERVQAEPSKENSEGLDALLNVRKKISSELDWPVDIEGVSALLVTFFIPSINFIKTLWGKP